MLLEQRPSAQTHAKGLQGSQSGTDPHRRTRTDGPAPVLRLPLSWRQWFPKEPLRGLFAAQAPHSSPCLFKHSRRPPGGFVEAPASTISRQMGGLVSAGSAAGRGSEEAAAPGPGHRLRQMDCLPGHPRAGSGGGPAAPPGALKQRPGLCPSFPQRGPPCLGTGTQPQPLPAPKYTKLLLHTAPVPPDTATPPTNTQCRHLHKHVVTPPTDTFLTLNCPVSHTAQTRT